MPRVKRGTTTKKRHKKLLKQTRGYRQGRKNLIGLAKQAILHAGVHAYVGRKTKKRTFRNLWIIKVNAAARENGLSYSRFMQGLKKAKIDLDRKVLAQLAENYPDQFKTIVEKVKKAL